MTTTLEDQRKYVPYVLERFPETDDELWLFVYALWGVKIPRIAVCPDHQAPFDAFADAFFARSPVAVWKASRGFGGKTHLLSVLVATELVALGCGITLLGGSGAQSMNVHTSMQAIWAHPTAPLQMQSRFLQMITETTNGGWAKTLMASQRSVRGPHPQRMRLDEIDEMDLRILKSAQGQPMRTKRCPNVETQTVMSSTHQYPEGTMTAMLNEAKARGWPVFQWCFKESSEELTGWLSHEEIERKRSEVSEYMWSTEYELQEPSIEGRAIDTDAIDSCFDGKLFGPEPVVVNGEERRYYEFMPPQHNRDYITGIDWAKERDWTIIATFDTTELPWKCVAWQRVGRLPWPILVKYANLRIARYGGKLIYDKTGIGNPVGDYLELPATVRSVDVVGAVLGGQWRNDMLSDYITAIEVGSIKYPLIHYAYAEHKYATTDDIYGKGHLPDSICAGALAWSMRNTRKHGSIGGLADSGLSRASSPWKLK
jgi:hypothetical protein